MQTNRQLKAPDGGYPTIHVGYEDWHIIKVGRYQDGMVLCELASPVDAGTSGSARARQRVAIDLPAAHVAAAMGVPATFYSWNRALRGAFLRGMRARAQGLSRDDCPYADKRKASGGLTWSRGFQTAWQDGFSYSGEGQT